MHSNPPLVFVVDAPWLMRDSLPGKGRGAVKHYPCMRTDDVIVLLNRIFLEEGLKQEFSGVVWFMWRLASMQAEALRVVSQMYLEPKVKSELVWNKLTATGLPWFGMGSYTRGAHEVCLLATSGKARPVAKNVRSTFAAKVGRHSEKPDEFYSIVERMYPDSKRVEVFARTVRPGWTQYGNQLGKW